MHKQAKPEKFQKKKIQGTSKPKTPVCKLHIKQSTPQNITSTQNPSLQIPKHEHQTGRHTSNPNQSNQQYPKQPNQNQNMSQSQATRKAKTTNTNTANTNQNIASNNSQQ